MREILHIIPHTHWDREWYMSFEEHRFYLVKLIDTLIETMENDSEFKYFHLDGQAIILKDYLQIKPENKKRLFKLIRDGRINVGPWYVLQDEFLTSGESNIRNMHYGIKYCRDFGVDSIKVGYFPDTFGNISQMPQILRGFGIENAVFGRGINAMGNDNEVVEQNTAFKSEIIWKSPDGSEVLGIFMANWYHNAYELPSDPENLKDRTEKILNDTKKFACTPYLLGLNGCDHEPVQRNLSMIVHEMKRLFPDVDFEISNFNNYLECVRNYYDTLKCCEGELTGQYSSGWGLLIDTASSRIDLKQKNYTVQNVLEREAEPFNVLSSFFGDKYNGEFLDYSWLTLLENHPHDSICCCSNDKVHKEMSVRFDKALQVANMVTKSSLEYITENIDTENSSDINICIFNKQAYDISDEIYAYVDFPQNSKIDSFKLISSDGSEIFPYIKHIGNTFTYTLPKDTFRKVKYVDRYKISFIAENVPALGWKTYKVEIVNSIIKKFKVDDLHAQNQFYELNIKDDGSLCVRVKKTNRLYSNLNVFEDMCDCGDEYTFRESLDKHVSLTSGKKASISIKRITPYSVIYRIEHEIKVPDGCTNGISNQLCLEEKIISYVKLCDNIPRIDVKTIIENKSRNHRLRMLAQTDMKVDTVNVDGQFDVIKRNINVCKKWEAPENPQRNQCFVELCDKSDSFIIACKGLNEYEILPDRTIAIPILRCIGEIGDWGYFPTPDSQMLGKYQVEYSFCLSSCDDRASAYQSAYNFTDCPLLEKQIEKHKGILPLNYSSFKIKGDFIRFSSLKYCYDRNNIMIRLYNSSDIKQKMDLTVPKQFKYAWIINLAEERQKKITVENNIISMYISPKKIVTIEFQENQV